jgi:hypothetical protein
MLLYTWLSGENDEVKVRKQLVKHLLECEDFIKSTCKCQESIKNIALNLEINKYEFKPQTIDILHLALR